MILCCTLNIWLGACISATSAASADVAEAFGISDELVSLALTMIVLGVAVGPPIGGALSEYFGRRPVYLISWALFAIFQCV